MRFGEPELPALLVSHHRPGFYMRVIAEGQIQAGDPIVNKPGIPRARDDARSAKLIRSTSTPGGHHEPH
jgi:MOSC domain-containing protein YiiM